MDYSVIVPKACKFLCWKRAKKKSETKDVVPAPTPPSQPPPPPSAPPPHHQVGHPGEFGPFAGLHVEDFENLSKNPRFGYIEHTGTWRLGLNNNYMDDYYYHDQYGYGPPPPGYGGFPGLPPPREFETRGHPPLMLPQMLPGPDSYHCSPYRGRPGPWKCGTGAHHCSPPLPPHRPRTSPPYPYRCSSTPPPPPPPPGVHYYPPPYYGGYSSDENPNGCNTM